ncbi:MAG TPA: single-stranded DNA-binding protein [Marmoricola sp.]|nr:single-stranded DNA-binding protein [Marmoricola sp.]
MNETYVTLQGWVGNDVEVRDVGDTQCASFRVGSTPRFIKNGGWIDGDTSWYTVNCWRSLARNASESIRRGDAVIVHGRVKVDVWQREDQPASVTWIVEATFVGHDLTKGTSTFAKAARTALDPAQDEAARAALHSFDPAGPRLDSEGNEVAPAA